MTAQNVTGAENKLVLLLRYPESRDANFFLSTCTVIEKFSRYFGLFFNHDEWKDF